MFRKISSSGSDPPKNGGLLGKKNFWPKLGLVVWAFVAVALWISMAAGDINLIFNILRGSVLVFILGHIIVNALRDGGRFMRLHYMDSKFILVSFVISLFTAFFYSAFLTGHWMPEHQVASACFGSVHIHHLDWSGFVVAFLGWSIFVSGDLKFWSKISFIISGFLALMFFVSGFLHGWFPDGSSFWKVSLFLISFFLFVGFLYRSNENRSFLFSLFIAISLGVSLGIFFDGIVGILFFGLEDALTVFGGTSDCF